MWQCLIPPHLARQISAGAGLLRETPGLRGLLGGALAPWVITLILHPHGQALVALRLALIVGAVLLYLALTGELARLRRDVRRMRALLRSTAPGQGALPRPKRLLMTGLCMAPREPRRPYRRVEPLGHLDQQRKRMLSPGALTRSATWRLNAAVPPRPRCLRDSTGRLVDRDGSRQW